MKILAIDPGENESAIVEWDGEKVLQHHILPNTEMIDVLRFRNPGDMPLIIEWIEGFGLTVGQSVFETCRWIGKFEQAYIFVKAGPVHLLSRRKVKQVLCNNVSAKDPHVREALLHKVGPVGNKKSPGPMYGVTSHKIAALAVAVAWMEIQSNGGFN
jgi:hypothetical protein